MPIASGSFDVNLGPLDVHDGAPAGLGRLSIDKQFSGGIVGSSHGEMVATNDPGAEFAAYVALELVDGSVHGKAGTFWLQHKATMLRGEGHMDITVVAGSATGELAGLTGSMVIDAANNHAYEFDYLLPE
ncbi:MAG: DUF3224 domain-containing protein [Actinobacteria bacterium]|nr:DUF3224 domain-containing protein [Actinomycetota bacterium]